ncbi:endonuclease III [Porifericola rhodea]|uniref:endonuclease III domain-containing protein n=1 Tax=Porifericola rhodea TaxID=930972 RepID=UPI002666F5F2|nr:endonuclease III [Porifericola rhodea]WKN32410.1 endonuclease III [Porifericola rhodea]
MPKNEAFNIEKAFVLLRKEVKDLPKAALFDLYDQGYTSLFEQLVACIISIRTYDEVTVPTALKLFEQARTPEEISKLSKAQIDRLIKGCTFYESKSRQILAIAKTIIDEYQGDLPADFDTLLNFKGVGPKCANLALGIACRQMRIGVDVHVHRVCNRWGYIEANSPEKSVFALQQKLPEKYSVEINRLLVPFGKHVCRGTVPLCSQCTLNSMCEQRGVKKYQ